MKITVVLCLLIKFTRKIIYAYLTIRVHSVYNLHAARELATLCVIESFNKTLD